MGLENPLHLMIVLVVVLMVFGAKRLPEMGRGLGDGLRGFREAMSGQPQPTQMVAHVTTPTIDEHNNVTVPAETEA